MAAVATPSTQPWLLAGGMSPHRRLGVTALGKTCQVQTRPPPASVLRPARADCEGGFIYGRWALETMGAVTVLEVTDRTKILAGNDKVF